MLLHHLRYIFFQLTADLIQLGSSRLFNRSRWRIISIGLLLCIAGCQATPAWMSPRLDSAPVALSILQIDPATGGRYTVSGTAALPNATQLTVSAIRSLDPASPSYAILDRQIAAVRDSRWEAQLNLWQPSESGQLQEGWQSRSAIRPDAVPAPTVTFLVTLDPPHQLPQLSSRPIDAQLSRYNADGELYLQASKDLTVPPPRSQTLSSPTSSTLGAPKPIAVPVVLPSPDASALDAAPQSIDQPLAPNASFR